MRRWGLFAICNINSQAKNVAVCKQPCIGWVKWHFAIMWTQRIREENAVARRECDLVNDAGRRQAKETGDWDNRPWLHPDEWVRIRPPLYVLAHIAKADSLITDSENEFIGRWLNDWLDRSHWAGLYTASKSRALEMLCTGLMTNDYDFIVCCEISRRKLSKAQMERLNLAIDQLEFDGSEATIKMANNARQALAN